MKACDKPSFGHKQVNNLDHIKLINEQSSVP